MSAKRELLVSMLQNVRSVKNWNKRVPAVAGQSTEQRESPATRCPISSSPSSSPSALALVEDGERGTQ